MAQTFNTTIGLTANASSAGQSIDFDGAIASSVTVGNSSGQSIQYAIDGVTWRTIASGSSAVLGTISPSLFRLRKSTADSYPVPVTVAWTANASEERTSECGNTFVLLGDSITANNMLATATEMRGLATGYFTAANILLGHRAVVVNYAGISGNTTAQMLARLDSDVLAYRPAYCVVFGGINDIANGSTAAQIISNLRGIYDRVRAAGITVIACTILPSTLRITTPALHTLLHSVNQWIKTYCETNRGAILVDTHAAFVDPTTGANLAAFSGDDLHPNAAGAWNLGRAMFEVLDPLLPKLRLLASSPTDRKNLIYNPLAVGNNAAGAGGFSAASGITGNGPNGWGAVRNSTGTGVGSKVARTDYWQGEFARLALTAAANLDSVGWKFSLATASAWFGSNAYALGAGVKPGNGFMYRCTTAGTSGGTQPTWPITVGEQVTDGTVTWTCYDLPTVGDTMEGFVEFQTSSFSGRGLVYAYIECLDGSAATIMSASDNQSVNPADPLPLYVPASGVLRIPEFTIPANTSQVNLQIRAMGAAGVTGNFDVSRVGVRLTNR